MADTKELTSMKRDFTSAIKSSPFSLRQRRASLTKYGQSLPMSARQKTATSIDLVSSGVRPMLQAVTSSFTDTKSKEGTLRPLGTKVWAILASPQPKSPTTVESGMEDPIDDVVERVLRP